MRDGGGGGFVDQPAGIVALKGEARAEPVRLAFGNEMGEQMRRTRRCLEAARTPAAIDEEVRHRRHALDRRTVRRVVGDAAPLPHHLDPAEDREQLADSVKRMGDDLQAAGLGIGIILVGARPDDEFQYFG